MEKLVVIVIISIPDPFNEFHKNEHNSAITCQSHLEFWDQKVKDDFSQQSKEFGHEVNIFGPRSLISKSLKEAWERQSLIESQNFDIVS